MNLTINGSIASFLLAVLVYFLFGAAVDTLIADEPAKKMFKVVLLFICLAIALIGSFVIKL